jgi:hypothetical protein
MANNINHKLMKYQVKFDTCNDATKKEVYSAKIKFYQDQIKQSGGVGVETKVKDMSEATRREVEEMRVKAKMNDDIKINLEKLTAAAALLQKQYADLQTEYVKTSRTALRETIMTQDAVHNKKVDLEGKEIVVDGKDLVIPDLKKFADINLIDEIANSLVKDLNDRNPGAEEELKKYSGSQDPDAQEIVRLVNEKRGQPQQQQAPAGAGV